MANTKRGAAPWPFREAFPLGHLWPLQHHAGETGHAGRGSPETALKGVVGSLPLSNQVSLCGVCCGPGRSCPPGGCWGLEGPPRLLLEVPASPPPVVQEPGRPLGSPSPLGAGVLWSEDRTGAQVTQLPRPPMVLGLQRPGEGAPQALPVPGAEPHTAGPGAVGRAWGMRRCPLAPRILVISWRPCPALLSVLTPGLVLTGRASFLGGGPPATPSGTHPGVSQPCHPLPRWRSPRSPSGGHGDGALVKEDKARGWQVWLSPDVGRPAACSGPGPVPPTRPAAGTPEAVG